MPDWRNFRVLVEEGRLAEAAKLLLQRLPVDRADLGDDLAVLSSDLRRLETERRRDAISSRKYQTEITRISYRLLDLARATGATDGEAAAPPTVASETASFTAEAVFLSYNHMDTKIAALIRKALEANGIPVRIDSAAMTPGEQIRAFILKSIGLTTATVGIVSRRSLLSSWVAQESLLALTVDDLWGQRRFVACYLDEDFLDLRFSVTATGVIDRKLAALDRLIQKHRVLRIDTAELNEEKSRLFALRNGLGTILARLRGGLCLDMRVHERAASLERLIEAFRPAARRPGRSAHG